MKKIIIILFMSLISISCFANDDLLSENTVVPEVQSQENLSENTEIPMDFNALVEPFLSRLPPAEKPKTPIDQMITPVHNIVEPPKVETIIKPVEKKVNPLPKLTVQGVILGDHPFAIINDQALSVGESIEGVKIRAIKKDGVIVTFDGRKFHVSLVN